VQATRELIVTPVTYGDRVRALAGNAGGEADGKSGSAWQIPLERAAKGEEVSAIEDDRRIRIPPFAHEGVRDALIVGWRCRFARGIPEDEQTEYDAT